MLSEDHAAARAVALLDPRLTVDVVCSVGVRYGYRSQTLLEHVRDVFGPLDEDLVELMRASIPASSVTMVDGNSQRTMFNYAVAFLEWMVECDTYGSRAFR